MNLVIRNYKSQERIEKDSAGTTFQHLGDIQFDNRVFVVYKVIEGPKAGEHFIEEKMNNKLSDMIWSQTELRWIEDEKLWQLLFEKAAKEGFFT